MVMNKKLGVLCLALFLIFAFGNAAVAQTTLSDISNHWAEQAIEKWSNEGVAGGYPDGTFQPNRQISRAEFVTIINKALGCSLQGEVSFSDVQKENWFYPEVAKAIKSGYIKGYQDGTFKPNNPISRQEAAVVFARIMLLTGESKAVAQFKDSAVIPSWSKDMVGAIAASGYMGGYPDKTFQPLKTITRAESLVTLERVVGELYSKSGPYGNEADTATVKGNVTISKPDVTLQNMIVEGNLYLAEGIGEGNVTLKNVTVKGMTIVRGGGINSIILLNFNGKTVVVDVPDGSNVRLVAQGTSTLEDVVLESNGILEEENLTGAGFTTVNIPAGAEVILKGNFSNVDVQGANASVKVETGVITNLNIAANATNAGVNLAAGSTVTNLTVKAPAKVTGTGTVTTANIGATGVTIAQTPTNMTISSNVTATVGGKEVSGGTTDGGTGGGGPGGGNSPAISISAITVTFSDKASLTDSTPEYAFDIKNVTAYPNKTLFTGIEIAGNNVASGTLVITQLKMAGQPWLDANEPIKVPISASGVVLTGDILKGFDTGEPGVNLGSLREFGQDILITGYVEKSGYSSSSAVEVTLQLSNDEISDLSEVANQWLNFNKSGITVTGTIKTGKSDTPLSSVGVLSFLWTQGEVSTTSISSGYVSGETAIKAQIVALAGGTGWDTVQLGDLSGKTIYYKSASGIGAYKLIIQ